MEGQGRGELERLKEQYQAEGRYGEACIERQADLATYLFRMRKRIKLDKALRKRGLGYLWDAFEQIKAQVDELDPIVWDALGGGGRPDNISDGLAQGIGVREIL